MNGIIKKKTDKGFGFISVEGQEKIASSIFQAFKAYKIELDGNHPADQTVLMPKAEHAKAEPIGKAEPVIKAEPSAKAEPAATKNNEKTPPISDNILIYKVQIKSSDKKISLSGDNLKDSPPVNEYVVNGLYKYTVGELNSMNQAVKLQSEMRKKGFPDAFVVTFKDGQRIK